MSAPPGSTVRVVLPSPLRAMANLEKEILVEVEGEVTQRAVLDVLEAAYPMLLGTIRGRNDGKRRAFVRFFACEEDLSHDDPDTLAAGRGGRRARAVHRARGDGRRLIRRLIRRRSGGQRSSIAVTPNRCPWSRGVPWQEKNVSLPHR